MKEFIIQLHEIYDKVVSFLMDSAQLHEVSVNTQRIGQCKVTSLIIMWMHNEQLHTFSETFSLEELQTIRMPVEDFIAGILERFKVEVFKLQGIEDEC